MRLRMNLQALSELNPDRFSIEEIQAIFGWWKWVAQIVINTGIRRGSFAKEGELYRFIE